MTSQHSTPPLTIKWSAEKAPILLASSAPPESTNSSACMRSFSPLALAAAKI
jgi:hypothetical protein